MLSHHLIQEGESWTAPVSKSLALIKATCSDIEDKVEKGPQDQNLMVHLSHYTQRLATMRTAYEYLVTMSMEYDCTEAFQLIQQWCRALLAPRNIEDRLHSSKTSPDHHEPLGLHGLLSCKK